MAGDAGVESEHRGTHLARCKGDRPIDETQASSLFRHELIPSSFMHRAVYPTHLDTGVSQPIRELRHDLEPQATMHQGHCLHQHVRSRPQLLVCIHQVLISSFRTTMEPISCRSDGIDSGRVNKYALSPCHEGPALPDSSHAWRRRPSRGPCSPRRTSSTCAASCTSPGRCLTTPTAHSYRDREARP